MVPLDTLTVDPAAIPVRNAWHLLLYSWDLASWSQRWHGAVERAPSLSGLLARVLVDCIDDLLRRQIGRAHQRTLGEVPGIRGKLDFARSIQKLSFSRGRAVCTYPEMTIDTPLNRLLKGTLQMLFSDSQLHVGAVASQEQALRQDLRRAVDRMAGVASVRVSAADLKILKLGRNDEAYRLPLAIAQLVLGRGMPTESPGDNVLVSLCRDEIRFSEVFERFIRNYLRSALPDAQVGGETLSWHDELESAFVPRMRTDVTVQWAGPTPRRLVIDAKYYANTLAARFGGQKFHSANLYQLYAYLRTQEQRGGAFQTSSGLLIYPATGLIIDERMRVQGHEIRVATLDLSQAWADIERDLRRLGSPAGQTCQPANHLPALVEGVTAHR